MNPGGKSKIGLVKLVLNINLRMITFIKNKFYQKKARISNPRYWVSANLFPLCRNDKMLLQLKDIHKGERCFIIGNGPSLNKLDLSLMKNDITFGVNAIYTNFEKMGFYPTYFAVEDIFVAEDRANEINSYKQSLKFFPNYVKHCIKKDEKTIFFNFVTKNLEVNSPPFSINAAEKVFFGGTVSYVCMQLAFYMGFSSVYLVGFDHNYIIPNSANVVGSSITSTEDDPNHFSSEYFGKGKRWHDPMVDRMEKSYNVAKNIFLENNRQILNATVGGKLEVFSRVDYYDLFKEE